MDMKVHGLPVEVLKKAMMQAKDGRDQILQHMISVIPSPRKEMSPYAPRVESIKINPDKIRDVIGKGGETINKIIKESGAEIDINDDGIIAVSAVDKASIDKAITTIKSLTAEPEIGTVYDAKVVKLVDFGAFVEIMPGREGLVHISEVDEKRIDKITDVLKLDDIVKVKLVAVDDQNRLVLSMKQAKKS
jgi:polyribonucleotide nucleotidyltransferase